MKYYIFWGNGFVGKHLTKALIERKQEVVVCDIRKSVSDEIYKNCEYVSSDIRNIEQISLLPIKNNVKNGMANKITPTCNMLLFLIVIFLFYYLAS
jgi:nucleoside-diphosphate-sugar epimerase